jgi:hypothetical protein
MLRSLLTSTSLVLAAAVFAGTASADPVGARSLVGSWNVHVSLPNPPSGLPPESDKLILFGSDGTTIESNGEPGFGAAIGQWAYAGNQRFDVTWLKQIRNPANGALLVIVKIKNKHIMQSDREFSGITVAEIYSPDGKLLLSFEGTVSGKRIEVEPLP